MRKKWNRLLAAGLMFLLLCTGCGSTAAYESPLPRYTVGVVLKSQESEHWQRIRAGMEHAAEELGVRLLIVWPADEQAIDEQQDMIADLLRSPIDALVVAPCDSWNCAWFHDEAATRGIPVFTTDTAALDCEIPYIGSDQMRIGSMAAEYMIESLSQGSRIGIVSGLQRQQSLADRTAAFSAALAEEGGLENMGIRSECLDFSTAITAANEMLAEDADALFCTSAVIGLAAAAAVQERAADVRIVAVDTQDDALEAVRAGAMDALITQSGDEIGRRTIDVVVAALEGKTVPEKTFVESELLTAENITAYLNRQNAEAEAWLVS